MFYTPQWGQKPAGQESPRGGGTRLQLFPRYVTELILHAAFSSICPLAVPVSSSCLSSFLCEFLESPVGDPPLLCEASKAGLCKQVKLLVLHLKQAARDGSE